MSIFRCVECDLHYCSTCDGGQDQCPTCHEGPLCGDCAGDHDRDHADEDRDEEGDEA